MTFGVQERHKAGESTASSAQHAELLERIHTAKLLRESNQTLRDENEANLRKVTQLDTRLRQALAELDPLKERVNTLLAESESKDNIISALERDNERWKARNQTILAKYERIDPEELQVLKDEVASLQARLATAEQEKADAKLAVSLFLLCASRFSFTEPILLTTCRRRSRLNVSRFFKRWHGTNGPSSTRRRRWVYLFLPHFAE